MGLMELVAKGGVVAVSNDDGFPLESFPPQGMVNVTYASGETGEVVANENEYRKAVEVLARMKTDFAP